MSRRRRRAFVPTMDLVSTSAVTLSWVLIWLLWPMPAETTGAVRPSGYTRINFVPELSDQTLLETPVDLFLVASELENETFRGEEALTLMRNRRLSFSEFLSDAGFPESDILLVGPAPLAERAQLVLSSVEPRPMVSQVARQPVLTGLMTSVTPRLTRSGLTLPALPDGIDLTGRWSVNIFVEFSTGQARPAQVTVESTTAPAATLSLLLRSVRMARVGEGVQEARGVISFSNRAVPPSAKPAVLVPKEGNDEH